jgi:hypothetical protein
VQACYFGASELGGVISQYFSTLTDIDMLFFNVAHYMGSIYDNAGTLIDIIRFGDPTTTQYWQYLGQYVGLLMNEVLYMPANYAPYTPGKRLAAMKDFPYRSV